MISNENIRVFGHMSDGRTVHDITLKAGDLTVSILTLGAILRDLRLSGVDYPLTLGSDDLAAYEGGMAYFGAIVGPVANRISGAKTAILGKTFTFEANERGKTTLHSGSSGVHAQVWSVESIADDACTLMLALPDGTGGFPGNRQVRATFRIMAPSSLMIELTAQTDAATLVNMANHSYWNLDGTATIEGHRLTVGADRYVVAGEGLIPTGEAAKVAGTIYDFREGRSLTTGPDYIYDTTFCLGDARGPLQFAAYLEGQSGVNLTLETTEPGVHVFDAGNQNTAPLNGLNGVPYGPFCGLALETQVWPDAPNQPGFPSILLRPGEEYLHQSLFTFSA